MTAMSDNLLMLLHMVEKCPDAYEKQLAKIREEAKKGAAELCQVAIIGGIMDAAGVVQAAKAIWMMRIWEKKNP